MFWLVSTLDTKTPSKCFIENVCSMTRMRLHIRPDSRLQPSRDLDSAASSRTKLLLIGMLKSLVIASLRLQNGIAFGPSSVRIFRYPLSTGPLRPEGIVDSRSLCCIKQLTGDWIKVCSGC